MGRRLTLRTLVLAVAVGLALADASIVTLALPELLVDLHTTVPGVAAVLIVYTAVFAGAVLVAGRYASRRAAAGLVAAGFGVLAAGSVVCAVSGSLPVLLAGRAIQALGGGAGVVGGFVLIDGGARGRAAWRVASVVGVALGPAVGGALTQAFDWRAIFLAQIPVALVGGACGLGAGSLDLAVEAALPTVGDRTRRDRSRRGVLLLALGAVSAALGAVLFLLVLLLVAGWDVSPLRAAATVTVLPVAAWVGSRVTGPPPVLRAATGCALIAGGDIALAWIPEAHLLWTVAPQILAGLGTGAAFGALSGELLPQRRAGEAARLLGVRSAGVALVLVALAPLISHQLAAATRVGQLRGIALVLDAKLPFQRKIALAPELFSAVGARQPRASLIAAFAAHRHEFTGADRAAYDQLDAGTQDTLLRAVKSAFRGAFIISGAFALLAAALLAASGLAARAPPRARASAARRRRRAAVAALLGAAVLVPVGYVAAERELPPAPIRLTDPCRGGPLAGAGGIGGFLQDRALELLDATACRLHTSREEFVLALASQAEAKRFAARHGGVDPRAMLGSLGSLLSP